MPDRDLYVVRAHYPDLNRLSSRKCHSLYSIFKKKSADTLPPVLSPLRRKYLQPNIANEFHTFLRLIEFRRKWDSVSGRGLEFVNFCVSVAYTGQALHYYRVLRVRHCVFSCVRSTTKNRRHSDGSRLKGLSCWCPN